MTHRLVVRAFLAPAICSLAAVTEAAPLFFDNFDNSFPGEPALLGSIWPKWPTATDHMNLSANRSHSPCGGCTNSVRQDPEDPFTLANYTDLSAAAVGVVATAWLWEDNNHVSTAQFPVNFYIGFYGDSPTGPTGFTDYLLLGISPNFANLNAYGYRTLTGGFVTTAVTRAAAKAGSADGSGWIKLAIRADSLSAGGQVRFYINDALVGASSRAPGVSLRYFFMGSQSKSYEFFWYDDISIVAIPEITGIAVASSTVTVNFRGAAVEQPSDFTLVSSSTINGSYLPAAGATITGGGGTYQATVSTNGAAQFYRIQR